MYAETLDASNTDYTILVVDDEDYIRELVSLILKREGFRIIEASNGREALDRLGETKVDMVISDLKMPEIDGIDFIKQVRSIDRHKNTPIIVLTGELLDYKREEWLHAGADDMIMKPFIPKQLWDIVSRIKERSLSAR
jgi:two-component system chemotaxis response regulator CheY